MTDLFLQIGLSNACFSLALAIVAVVVGATVKRPHLTNLLWLLVLVKLVTPPLVTIPVVPIPGQGDTAITIEDHSRPAPLPVANGREFEVLRSAPQPAGGREFDISRPTPLSTSIGTTALKHARQWFPPIWLLGSVVVFV